MRLRPASGTAGTCLGVAIALAAAGCAGQGWFPDRLRPTDTRDDVIRSMGPPTAVYPGTGGGTRLEYNHMPAGRQTFMVDLGPDGRFVGWQQVLDERHFDQIQPGMTRDDVLARIGPPTDTSQFARPEPGITWLYRFETIQRCILFRVAFDRATGRVLAGDYPPDPACPDVRD